MLTAYLLIITCLFDASRVGWKIDQLCQTVQDVYVDKDETVNVIGSTVSLTTGIRRQI